jgi:hypothetical protein
LDGGGVDVAVVVALGLVILVAVLVGVGDTVLVGLGAGVAVSVAVPVRVGVLVRVGIDVRVFGGVKVGVAVCVPMGVRVGVGVCVDGAARFGAAVFVVRPGRVVRIKGTIASTTIAVSAKAVDKPRRCEPIRVSSPGCADKVAGEVPADDHDLRARKSRRLTAFSAR